MNEVVLRIERADSLKKFANRRVFFSVATQAMKQILTDQYRRQKRREENGLVEREPLDTVIDQVEVPANASVTVPFPTLATALRLDSAVPVVATVRAELLGGRGVAAMPAVPLD